MRYGMLGSVAVHCDDEELDLGGPRQRALLALLLINANTVVSTDRIIDELWGESTGKDRQNALWVTISRLRAALEPDRPKRSDGTILVTQQPGYVLNVSPDEVDVHRFEALAREGRSLLDTDPAAASLVLGDALSLWRGHVLEEFTYEPFAAAEIERLEELRLAAVEDRVEADLRRGRTGELVGELESLVRQHPLRQRMAGQLMLALHLSGRQGDALRAFGALRSRLAEELGLDPSHDLTRLEERIVLDDPTLRHTMATASVAGRAEPGLSVRGYELRGKLGEGSTGHVYSAFQSGVGREVAIKVIRPELANDADFIRRFEAEAQVVASLEHPQIVPVFDYWREPDSAYLVMRRFERGSLADALDAGPMETATAVTILAQVGAGLAAAHRRGIAHGDLKPANVLLDDEGNAYLADFGMSFGGRVGDRRSSDAAFTAPEQLESGGASVLADIYSYGALVSAALRGAIGNGRSPDSPMVGPVADVVAQATAVDPERRFGDVRSFTEALADAFGESVTEATGDDAADDEVVNPYRGLRAFAETDAAQFYGRERLVERLLARLGHAGPQGRFVALVGPSGSGKSSVVRAGVVPALRAGAVAGSDRWFVVTMTPGRHPFDALDDALRTIAVHPPADLLERLTTEGIASSVESLTADPAAQVVVVVDQLEELFSHAASEDADSFLDALAAAATDRTSKVKVVATLRADFYDRPLRHGAFGELLRLGTEVITPMNAQELDRAITTPASEVGVVYEAGLPALIAADMAGQATALPLLQHALTELFDQRQGRTVTTSAYQELGGVSGALARRADALFDALDDTRRRGVRDVFLRLVTVADDAADTRRRATSSELMAVAGDDVSAMLDTFGHHRLLSFDRDPVTRGPTVEIAHEALLTEWTRLRDWIDDVRNDIRSQRRLATSAAEWIERDRDRDFVLTGARLGRYDGWLERPPVRLTSDEHAFLAASHDATDQELEIERHRVRRLRRLVSGVAVLLVLALVAGGVALRQQQRASDEASRAEAAAVAAEQATGEAELATLISRSAAVGDDDPELALLLALEARARRPGGATDQAVVAALSADGLSSRVVSRDGLVDDCFQGSFFADGIIGAPGFGIVELAQVDGRMLAREPVTGEVVDSGPAPVPCSLGFTGEDYGFAVAIDGSQILTGPDLDVALDVRPGTILQDGTPSFVITTSDGGIELFDVTTGKRIGTTIRANYVDSTRNRDESLVAVSVGSGDGRSDDGKVVVLDAVTGEQVAEFGDRSAFPLAFDEATGDLIAGYPDGEVVTVDPTTGTLVTSTVVEGATIQYLAVAARADGHLIMVARGGIDIVDRNSGVVSRHIELQNVGEAIIRPDELVVAIGPQGHIDVYDLDTRALVERSLEMDRRALTAMAVGTAVLTNPAADDGPLVEVVALESGERAPLDLATDDGDRFAALEAFPEPDGVWAISADHVLARWQDGRMVDELFLGSAPGVVNETGWYEGGRRHGDYFAAIGRRRDRTNEVSVVRLGRDGDRAEVMFTIETEFALNDPDNQLGVALPTATGGVHVIDEPGVLRTYDESGILVSEIETGILSPVMLAADPTASTLVAGGLNGRLVIVDAATNEVSVVPGTAVVSAVGFNADGTQLVMSTFGGEIRLFDVEDGGTPVTIWNGAGTLFSEPGWYDEATDTMWITASGQILGISLDPERWVERACSLLERSLTQDEWDRYVPGDQPRRSVCPA